MATRLPARFGATVPVLALVLAFSALVITASQGAFVPPAAATTSVIFSDGFETGSAAWTRVAVNGGTAAVSASAAYVGTRGIRLAETTASGSIAYARKTFPAAYRDLAVTAAVRVRGEGPRGRNVPLLRLFDASGTRILSVYRANGASGRVYASFGGTAHATSARLALGTWAIVRVRARVDGTRGTIDVRVNGRTAFSSADADLGSIPLTAIQLGNEVVAQPFALDADAVVVEIPAPPATTPGLSPSSSPPPGQTPAPSGTPGPTPAPSGTPGPTHTPAPSATATLRPTASPTPPLPSAPTGCGSLQARIDATPTGGTLDLGGCSYTVSTPATIARAMTVRGGNVMASASAVLVAASNVTVSGMTLRGPGGSGTSHYAIQLHGPTDGAYLSNITISGNTISDWDGDGLLARFVDGFTFSDNVISNVYYAGIEGYSVRNGRITGNTIRNVTGTGNAYGIALTRGYGGGLAQNPRSSDVEVSGNTIEDVPNWHCLDTHAGQRIRFVNNTVRRCLYGIFVTGATEGGGAAIYAPLDVSVSGNSFESGVTNGSRDFGVYFGGANAGSGVPGSWNELATGVISGNTIIGHGQQSNGDSAAIQIRDTSGLQITGNTITEASPTAIEPYLNNLNFSITGNIITDPWSNSLSYAYGVYVHVDYNTGTISGNTFRRGAKSATSVLTENIVVLDYPHNNVSIR
jgi:hypothetical protein